MEQPPSAPTGVEKESHSTPEKEKKEFQESAENIPGSSTAGTLKRFGEGTSSKNISSPKKALVLKNLEEQQFEVDLQQHTPSSESERRDESEGRDESMPYAILSPSEEQQSQDSTQNTDNGSSPMKVDINVFKGLSEEESSSFTGLDLSEIRRSQESDKTEAGISPIPTDVSGEADYVPENLPLEQEVLGASSKSGSYGDTIDSSQEDEMLLLSDEDRTQSSSSVTETRSLISQEDIKKFLINSNVYECKKCRILYKDDIVYRTHMRVHVKEMYCRYIFDCKCKIDFKQCKQFHYHLIRRPHNLDSYQEDEELLPWDLPYSIDDGRKLMWWNWQATDGLYMCPDCLMVFYYHEVYLCHDLHHDRKEKSSFKCRCKQEFTNRVDFNRHLIEEAHC